MRTIFEVYKPEQLENIILIDEVQSGSTATFALHTIKEVVDQYKVTHNLQCKLHFLALEDDKVASKDNQHISAKYIALKNNEIPDVVCHALRFNFFSIDVSALLPSIGTLNQQDLINYDFKLRAYWEYNLLRESFGNTPAEEFFRSMIKAFLIES